MICPLPLGEGSRVSLTASTQKPSNLLSDQKVPNQGGTGIEMTDGGEGGPGGILASDIPQQFETLKLRKETMEKGIKLYVCACTVHVHVLSL